MSGTSHTFFITGATGNQGGALARQLLSAGHKVNTLVRSPNSPAAAELKKLGATLIEGDFENISALSSAAASCYGVFLNTSPTRPSETEIGYATNIINAAKAAGVKRIVYSSAARAEQHETFTTWDPEGLSAGYWRTKTRIQELVQKAGFESWTILQPAWIMTDWVAPVSRWYWADLAEEKTLLTAFAEDTRVHLTDPADIGGFAARALTSENGELSGEIVKVAGDDLTIVEIAAEMSRVSGTEVRVKIRSDEEIEKLKGSNPFVASQLWQRMGGSEVDVQKVRGYGIEVTSFKKFLESNKEALQGAFD